MAGVEYSIYFNAPSDGLNTINLLKAPTTLVGVVFTGQWLGIVIDATRTAYIPGTSSGGVTVPMIPVVYTFQGLVLNVVYQFAGQVGVLYFGSPLKDSVPLDAYAGVYVQISASNSGTAAANLTASGTLKFPQGAVRLVGLAYILVDTNSSYDIWSFTTAGGLLIQGQGVSSVGAGGRFMVLPLDNVFTAQSLTISVNMYDVKASSSHSVIVIGYYQL